MYIYETYSCEAERGKWGNGLGFFGLIVHHFVLHFNYT